MFIHLFVLISAAFRVLVVLAWSPVGRHGYSIISVHDNYQGSVTVCKKTLTISILVTKAHSTTTQVCLFNHTESKVKSQGQEVLASDLA